MDNSTRNHLFIRLSKLIFKDKYWASLDKSSKAILPPIMKFCDAKGKCFPSQATIAKLAGVNEKTVCRGLKGLKDFPLFEQEKYLTNRLRWANRYTIHLFPVKKCVTIYHTIFTKGFWARLSPSAKCVYPVLLYASYFDPEVLCKVEGIKYNSKDRKKYFKNRNCDIVDADLTEVARHSGVSIRAIPSAYNSLIDVRLMKYLGKLNGRETYVIFKYK